MISFIKKLFWGKSKSKQEIPSNYVSQQTNQQIKVSPAICPYCHKELIKKPQRKKKCPFCGNYIFVKRRLNSKIKELVTEEEAKIIEIEWNKFYSQIALIRDLEDYGFTEKEFNQRKEEKIKKGEKEPSNRDVIWLLFNEKLQNNMKANDFAVLSGIYYDMARFLIKEGRNPYETLKQSQKMGLLAYQKQGVEKVEISWSGNGCEACKQLDGEKYIVKKAIEEMPLPNKNCSEDVFEKGHPWCRCNYLPVI